MNIYHRAVSVGIMMKKINVTLGVCESCTGGMLGSAITSVVGSSAYFRGGVIAYSNDIKVRSAGVRAGTLRRHGAVSTATAREMARGARDRLDADIGIGITGIAGPTGGTRTKPVGRMYISIAIGKKIIVKEYTFRGTRRQIRRQACEYALRLLETAVHRSLRSRARREGTPWR